MKKSAYAGMLILLTLLLNTTCFARSKKPKPVVFNLQYSFSQEPPSSIEREIIPNIEKLIKKHLVKFGRKLQKKYKVTVIDNASKNKLKYINAFLMLDDIHTEYAHNTYTDDYSARVTLTVLIQTPDSKTAFERMYLSNGKLHFTKQWAEWIGIKKIADFTIDRVLTKIINDVEFGEALTAVDKESFFDKTYQKETKEPDHPEKTSQSIEERLTTLQNLKDKKLITEEEYQEKKQSILNEL